jgi:hypothetical protein
MFKKEATIFSVVEVWGFLVTAEEDPLEELEACLVNGFKLTALNVIIIGIFFSKTKKIIVEAHCTFHSPFFKAREGITS